MGLLTIPKKYNPPGKGTPMEYPIFASKQEMGLLKMHGGAGKMTRHGIRSFYKGDKGNAVGSAGGSNYSGDGKGGQVNMSNVGGKTGNVLRSIDGKWTVVSKASGQPMGGSTAQAPIRMAPTIAPVAQPITAMPSVPASVLAAQYGMYKNPTANMPAAPASYPNSMPGNSNPSLNYGPGTTNSVSPGVALDPSINGRNAMARRNEMTGIGGGVQGGQGIVGYESGPVSKPASPAGNLQSSLGYQDPQALEARARAVSRGPGSVAGVMPGASALSQQRTMQTLGNAMTEGGFPMSAADVQNLSKTVFGEAGRESPMGQTAVANTMLNRMSLAASDPSKYGYMGGANIKSLMGQYDATGPARAGGVPNSAFESAQPGTDALGQGIASLAGAASPNSMFNTMAPASIRNATHFYNPQTSNPSWGGPGFTDLGNHTFGNAEPTGTQVASLRSNPSQGGPTMVASAAGGPPAAVSDVPSGSWLENIGKMAQNQLQQANVQFTDANKKINQMGGGERVAALAKTAQSIMSFMGGIGGAGPTGPGGQERGGQPEKQRNGETAVAEAAPVPTPPVNPAAPQLVYPQYTQTWANLPTGSYGTAWRPKPPSKGLFASKDDEKKRDTKTRRGWFA